jgi:NTE family protein
VLITAVDASTGEPVVFDRHSGVDLAHAVAASCASRLRHRIGDTRCLDGGVAMVFPDSDSTHVFGANAVDLSLGPPDARTGDD